ncbi:MAG: cytochrome B5 [Deltaproteobacteria bacterium]|nr:cytochrome B5 [Deltaproteobacteria bacterium]
MAAALMVVLAWPVTAVATEEYAERSGQACGVCHVDPGGGGLLTPTGAAFQAGGFRWPIPAGTTAPTRGRPVRWLRFGLGLTHLVTAVIWLGTIFYVHLVLRPHYALGGLPKTEMRLAWACMALLGLTGVPLTFLRFGSLGTLVSTRSGRLLLVKIGLYLFLVASAAVVTRVLSPRLRRARTGWQEHDGTDGRPAWVRVGDRVYDLTRSPRWAGGVHFRRHRAGEDLTRALEQAPHGTEKLEGFPSWPVTEDQAGRWYARTLLALAYVNLVVALAVLVVVALGRWG